METSGHWNSEAVSFEYIKKLGEGGFGEVWLADDPRRGEKVAVKFLHLKHCDQNNIDVFKREFEILAELKQIHLARVFDFGFSAENEQYYLSTEFCPGKSLIEAIEGKPVSYFEEVLVQVLSALECIHSQGIIHFDIKPENILVEDQDGHPNVKLVDFGVAVRLKALPQQFGGTLAFIAPEVLAHSPRLDHRVDLYSLGMLALFCLTHRLPFNAFNADEVMEWHRSGSISPSLWKGREVPGYLREIAEKLLAKNPSDRFSNSRVVLNFLNLATGGKYRHEEEELNAQIPIEGPVVERREEVLRPIQQHLEKALSADSEPISSVVFISGEAGIGKSRVLEEIRHLIQVKEVRFLQITCDWNIPAWTKVEEWLKMPPATGDSLDLNWQTRRRMDSILEAAKEAPLCLLIDDFQKSDKDLRSLVLALEERTKKLREEGQSVPLFVLVATEEEDLPESIRLPHLSARGVSNYLKLVLGESLPIDNLADVLFKYSGGLPLLVVEGLRFLAPHFFRGESLENLLRPEKIHLLYEEKLKRLKSEEEEFLLILALLFRSVSEAELRDILEIEASDFDSTAKNCLKLGLVSGNPYGDPVYHVSSQALALDLIGGLEAERRRQLHRKISRGLEKIPGIQLQELAYHSAKAGESAKAVSYYRNAGTFLEGEGKISMACDCIKRAADLVDPGSEDWQSMTVKAFRLLILSGNYKEAEIYPSKLEKYPSWERDEALGWFYFRTTHFPEARASYQEALKKIPNPESLQGILIENALGNIDMHSGQAEAAVARFQKTLEWQGRLAPEERTKVNNNNLGISLSLVGQHDEAIRIFTEKLAGLENEKVAERISCLNGIGFACLRASRYGDTISYLKQAIQLAEESGALNALFSAMGNLLTALLKENRYAEGLSILQKVVSYQRRFGNRRDIAHNLLRQTSVYLMLGMGEFAFECIREGLKISQEIAEGILTGWFHLLRAYWERDFGTFEVSEEFFLLAEAQGTEAANEELCAWAQYGLAEIGYDQGKPEKCRMHLEKVKSQGKDHEFETRLRLLQAKVATVPDPSPLYADLEAECLKIHYRELLWEVYQGWAQSCLKRKKKEEATVLFDKGWKIVEEICAVLPEEYQGRYRNLGARKKLYEEREAAKNGKRGFFAKLGFK